MTDHDETRAAPGPHQPYTVHSDTDAPGVPAAQDTPAPRAGGPDPIALIAGVVALVVAALALTGGLAVVDPRWVVALGALVAGGALLLATRRRRRT